MIINVKDNCPNVNCVLGVITTDGQIGKICKFCNPQSKIKMTEKKKDIPINIWDDYAEDGDLQEGELQETYLYVENTDLSLEFRKESLDYLLPFINECVSPKVKVSEYHYDSKIKYPTLPEYMHFERPEIRFINLSHEERNNVLEKLINLNLYYK